MSYSQTTEEPVILEYFGDKSDGRLLEIGAYHPTCFSNTRALIERGWEAVMVEASPSCFTNLLKEYQGNQKVTLINACLGDSDGFGPFWNSDGACATTHKAHADFWSTTGKQGDFWKIYMPYLNTKHVIDCFPAGYDFISIDTEGSDLKILSSIRSDVLQNCKLICIEYGAHFTPIMTILASYDFKILHQNGENIIAGKA